MTVVRPPGWLAFTAALALAVPAGAARQPNAPDVAIVSPEPGTPLFGVHEVVIEIYGSTPERVQLYLDQREVGSLSAPPWVFSLDLGQDNRERRLHVVAHAAGGLRGEATLTIPAIHVDEHVDLPLQQLYVTVERAGHRGLDLDSDKISTVLGSLLREPASRRVLDLERGDFQVLDDGVPQRLVTFERGDVPLTAVLMLDSSLSMRGPPLAAALGGARAFLRAMAPLDEAMLSLFADRELFRSPFAHDPEAVEQALETVRAEGGTALNDTLYLAVQRLAARPGRRVVVILSDGVDIDSVLPIRDVQPAVVRSAALVYWLRLRASGRDGGLLSIWRDPAEHQAELAGLERLVTASGGRVRELASIEEAESAFAEVLAELREQYVLGYYPLDRSHDARWRRVEVRLSAPGLVLRHRTGYFAD